MLIPEKVEVRRIREGEFLVTVGKEPTASRHNVTLKESDYVRLSGAKIEREELIAKSFEFLLERETKESILAGFDLLDIARYFPSFERDIQRRVRVR
jgi:hypothetical protein